MDPDIQKAVDAGKITPQAGAALDALKPGSYCLHKSWGFGQIDSLNFLVGQVTIHFKGKRDHSMQLQYAAESLQPIPNDHILALKATNLAGVKQQAKEDPVGFVRSILKDYDNRMLVDQLARTLQPDVFNETEFKRWWDSAKKALKKDGRFLVPAKKTDPIEMRDAAVSRSTELLAVFSAARQLKDQLAALDQITKNIDAFADPVAELTPVITAAADTAKKSQRLHTAKAFELIFARDEICAKSPGLEPAPDSMTIAQLLREEDRRLADVLPGIPAAKQKRLFAEFPKAFGDEWTARAVALMSRCNIRVVSEIARILQDQGKHEDLRRELDRSISEHSISTEVLYWLCKDRNGIFSDLITPQVFSAILTALERDQFSEIKRGGKLHDLFLDDRELIPDLLDGAEQEIVRDSMRKLLLTPVFEELNKRSLIGRIIRIYPEMQSLLTGETNEDKQEALIVSWGSLEKRKAEYEDLVNKKIPENTKEISVARSYGDLRENFEFKAAKEMQRVLMRRKSETERDLSRARGTHFENPDVTQVSIGTVVTIRNSQSASPLTYTILGAWDGEPEKNIISYLTAIGQALLGHKVGEQVELPTETGTDKVEIVSIEAWRAAAVAVAV
jgi:transcription elongation GreA/GreB family factor